MRYFVIILIKALCLILFSKCFVLNKYIYTDKEINEHYKSRVVCPVFETHSFLDYKIHYAKIIIHDTLPYLIFVHGAPGAWYGFLNLMDDSLLQQKFNIIAVDRVGYGKSNYGKQEVNTALQARCIHEVIKKENKHHRPVTLLGRSYGAPICAKICINYFDEVNHLVMVSPVIDPTKEKFYWFSKLGKRKLIQLMLPKMLNVATEEKYAHAKEMTEFEKEWERLYVPTTVVTGAADRIADTSNFSYAKKHLINCDTTLLMIKDAGHLVTYEKPELIRSLLLKRY